jgi:4-deoxy-L-threo-5-hexosulose-uronate ketol-isomerase
MTVADLAESFLVGELFVPGELRLAVTGLDRLVAGGAVPQGELTLAPCAEFGTRYFTERRELGVLNLGMPGAVHVGGEAYPLETLDGLYVGAGQPDVRFASGPAGQAVFYLLSCPAHCPHPTAKIARPEAETVVLGDERTSSKRCIRKYIHPGGARSCQLTMGYTELAPGSVWNTMPAHRHARRSEIYLYFDLEDGVVVHLMGEPGETRHLMVRDRQAVLSPAWSIHCGAGTRNYRFVWGMAGENQNFSDLDAVSCAELR